MGDDYKEYRRNKPQQKLYKPGSGPLRRSSYGLDAKMDTHDVDNGSRRYRMHYGSQNSVNDDMSDAYSEHSVTNVRYNFKKPEQQLYVARTGDSCTDIDKRSKGRYDNSSQYNNRRMYNNLDKHGFTSGPAYRRGRRDPSYGDYNNKDGANNDVNYNRQSRQTSETRSSSPTQHIQEQNAIDRNRDSRSMETSAGRHIPHSSGAKPPSGRRNSAGYMSDTSRPKYMVNLDNLPPRLRKKYLEQSGHHNFDNVDQTRHDKSASNYSLQPSYNDHVYTSSANWSQTLPSRGRGRLRDNEGFDRDKFINAYIKNYEVQHSRRSTPSSSYLNLYEPSAIDHGLNDQSISTFNSVNSHKDLNDEEAHNGMSNVSSTSSYNQTQHQKQDTDNDQDSETTSQISSTLLDLTNLDWTEEVEKNIKLDDMCDTSTSFSQKSKPSVPEELKAVETKESKRSGKSRRKDRRSSSRGLKNSEKKERNRKDSTASIPHEPDTSRKDSNVGIQHEGISCSLKRRERERRDSHRSNRSSTIGNSRDDLDRWRSLRSYSREQSTEGRIVSQCNSRDTSTNRAVSPRDNDGFRVPCAVTKSAAWLSTNQKKNSMVSGNGRTTSAERGRQSPVAGADVGGGAGGEGGGGRRSRRRSGRRRGRAADSHPAPTPAPTPPSAPVSAPPPAHVQTHAHTSTNWREEILESKRLNTHDKHPESTNQRKRLNSAVSEKSESSTSHPGLIMLPQGSISHLQKDLGRVGSTENQKTLYDHHNPSKPIIVQTSPSKVDMRLERGIKEASSRGASSYEGNEAARAARHRSLLQEVDRSDVILQMHILKGPLALAEHWSDVTDTRTVLQNALQKLLMSDLKFCQADNVEHNFWKILYYNFIELLRKSLSQASADDKAKIVKLINIIIDEGNAYFESLVHMLEKSYKFNVDDYINDNHVLPPKGLGYVGLALISVQKLYVFLGDLARYKEQVNETNNYAKSKLWYTKAQQINPKNGRPYNQLAILAIYARRKLDAVYYYMRSLMSSNPFQSARESLLSLFDENRKKYEAAERKRRAALEGAHDAESAGGAGGAVGGGGPGVGATGAGAGREVWVRPGGRRAPPPVRHHAYDEHIAAMTPVELNKNFITSYLHVHGKLITKIGMESFHECAGLMLRQFRALLHRQPLPMPAARLLQLTALNMFAVETTAASLKDGSTGGERTAWLECALGVSLLMFGALVERCCALLPEPTHSQHHADALLILPAIKVWSDWMLCHSSVWNPPPVLDNFDIELENDPWDWLAKLMNIFETLDDKAIELESHMKEGYVCVRLPEDASLGGFTPLMYIEPAAAWARADHSAYHHAEHVLRTRKLLFFGTEYLVGVEPPVLRLQYPADAPARYVSAVRRAPPLHPPLQHLTEDSEDEASVEYAASGASSASGVGAVSGGGGGSGGGAEHADEATRSLLRRKKQLESRKATLDRHRERMQEILRSGQANMEVEVRPRWLVPDTNCFIDHLPLLQAVVAAPAQPYMLAVPLVVMTELEGLRRCARVGGAATAALAWVGGGAGASGGRGAVRLATTRGSLLASRAFTAERDSERSTNDDRVLATALNLHANLATADADTRGGDGACELSTSARRVREVVLLTDDRNLRVKALAAELPARDLPSFIQWAGLCSDDTKKSPPIAGDDGSTAGRK